MRVAEGLNAWEGGEIVEVEVGAGEKGNLQRADRETLGLWRRNFLRVECSQSLEDVLI